MATDDKIRYEKLQYNINIEVAQISALSSGKIDKYKYLAGEETLPSNWSQIIKQSTFTYSTLEKALEKQAEKQFHAIEYLDFSNKISELD